jgi:hypothetical protein
MTTPTTVTAIADSSTVMTIVRARSDPRQR